MLALAAPRPAATQAGGARAASGGAELRQYRIGPRDARQTIRQVAVPVGAVLPFGRLTVDVGTALASSSLEDEAGQEHTVSSLTDTQVRGSLTFGRDLLVVTLLLNLPTGLDRASAEDFAVLGAVSSSLLAMPVNAHGNGFSATSGVALAVPAGSWNLGIAGSIRLSGSYTPYVDASGPFSYQSGVEGRARVGVDRLIGRSRATAGFTYSTFGTDEFGSGSAVTGFYKPGERWLAEGSLASPLGRSAALLLVGWHFRRTDGDSLGSVVGNHEELTGAGAILRVDLAAGARLEVGADARTNRLGRGTAYLVGGGIGLTLGLARGLSLAPSVRYDRGRIEPPDGSLTVTGVGASVFLRTSF
jgi:hypothetical protein